MFVASGDQLPRNNWQKRTCCHCYLSSCFLQSHYQLTEKRKTNGCLLFLLSEGNYLSSEDKSNRPTIPNTSATTFCLARMNSRWMENNDLTLTIRIEDMMSTNDPFTTWELYLVLAYSRLQHLAQMMGCN